MIERSFVREGWFRESGKLPNKLKSRCADFVVRRRWLEIMQGLDVSTHEMI
jgi:hypothetical protein